MQREGHKALIHRQEQRISDPIFGEEGQTSDHPAPPRRMPLVAGEEVLR